VGSRPRATRPLKSILALGLEWVELRGADIPHQPLESHRTEDARAAKCLERFLNRKHQRVRRDRRADGYCVRRGNFRSERVPSMHIDHRLHCQLASHECVVRLTNQLPHVGVISLCATFCSASSRAASATPK
jgi:hypothetical protein